VKVIHIACREGGVCLFVLLFVSWGGWVDMDWVRGSMVSHVLASSMNAFRSYFILSVG